MTLVAPPSAFALSASIAKKDLTVVNYEKRADANGKETEYVVVQTKEGRYMSVRKSDWYAQGDPNGKVSAQVKGPGYKPASVPMADSPVGKMSSTSNAAVMPPMPPTPPTSTSPATKQSRVQNTKAPDNYDPYPKDGKKRQAQLESDLTPRQGFSGDPEKQVELETVRAQNQEAAAPAPRAQVVEDRSHLGPVKASKTAQKNPWDLDYLKTESSSETKIPYRLPEQAKPAGETPLVQELKPLRTDDTPMRDAPGVVRGGGAAQQVYTSDFSKPSKRSEVNINGTKQTGYIVTKGGNSKEAYFVSEADWDKGVKSEGTISATPLTGQNKTDYQAALKDNDATLARLKSEGREYYDAEYTAAQNDRSHIEAELAKQNRAPASAPATAAPDNFEAILANKGKDQPTNPSNEIAARPGHHLDHRDGAWVEVNSTTKEVARAFPQGSTPVAGTPGVPGTVPGPNGKQVAPQKFEPKTNYAGYEYSVKDGVPTLTKDKVDYKQTPDGWFGKSGDLTLKAKAPNGGFLPSDPDAAIKALGSSGTVGGGGALSTNGLVEGKEFRKAGEWKPGNKAYDAADKAAEEQVLKEYPKHGEVDEYPESFYASRKAEIMAESKAKYNPDALVSETQSDYRSVVVPTKDGKEFEVSVRDGKVYQQNPTNGEMIKLEGVTPESLQTDAGRAKAQSQLASKEQLDPYSNLRGKSDEVDEDKHWRDKKGTDKECDVSSRMGMKTNCKTTRTTVQFAQMSNQLTQMAGAAAVTVQGQVANQKAANEGTQEASLRAAARQAKFAGMKDMGLGTVNSGFGILQAMKARGHGKQEKQFDDTATAAETSILGDNDKAGRTGDGRGEGSQGFITGSDQGLTKKFIAKYDLNRKYTPLTVDVDGDCADKKGTDIYETCIKAAVAKRESQHNSKAKQIGGDVSDKASTGAGEQAAVKDQAKSGAMMSTLTGVSQLITGFFSLKAAKDYEKAAAELEAANRAAIPPPEFDETPANQTGDARSPFTTPQIANESGLADNTNMADGIPPMDPGFNPGGGGDPGPGGPAAAPFELSGGGDGGGGRGPGALGGGGGTSAVPVEKEPGTQLAMEERGKTYLETGGGSKATGNRAVASSDNGNSGLAELFNKLFPPDDASKNHLDIEKQANRGLASSASGSLLGKEVNIFGRVTDRYRHKNKSGAVGI